MDKDQKEQVVAELTERLRTSETLIVADYRGLTNAEIEALRTRLLEHGARFAVVKNTLTRRAAEAAGAESLLALLEGPSAIAFVESGGDPVAVAKALGDAARETRILAVRGGVLEGQAMSAEQVENLAKLPAADVLRAQLAGAILSPLTTVVALLAAPLRDLVGLIDARIEQMGGADVASPADAEEAIGEGPPSAEATAEPDSSGGEAEAEATDVGQEPATANGDSEPIAQPEAARDTETSEEE